MPPKSDHISLSLLNLAHPPEVAQQIHLEKVIQRPLFLKPNPLTSSSSSLPQTAQQARRARREALKATKKIKPKPLSSRQKRALQLHTLPRSSAKYATFLGLHALWQGYIAELLDINTQEKISRRRGPIGSAEAAKLTGADFHGAEVECVRSRCVSRVGVRGVVVKDSMRVFEVVTKGDTIKILPKEGSVFRFWVDVPKFEGEDGKGVVASEGNPKEGEETTEGKEEKKEDSRKLIFEIHGDQFMYRAADRANRKFKPHYLKSL